MQKGPGPNRSIRLREEVSSQRNRPWGCSEQPRQLRKPVLVPPERGHWQNSLLLCLDSPDYLRDQGDWRESIKEEVETYFEKYVWQWVLYSEVKRSTSGLPKIPHIFPEPFVSGASTRLRGHCSKIACLLPGSVCPAHALLSARASWGESTSRSVLLEKRAASRKDRPGVLYRTPPSYCQVKSSHLYLYSAFNNTNCNKALHNIKIGKFVNNVKWQDLTLSYLLNAFHYWI